MRILIEGHQYDVADVKDVLHGIDALENIEGKVSIHYVGYYYNSLLADCVFILPKVLLKDVDNEELVFGKYRPEAVMQPDDGQNNPLDDREREFLYKFAVWIYRAIVVYKNSHADSDIVYHMRVAEAGRGRRRKSNTYLDILLSLIQFGRDNRNFFFFILKNLHSGYNRINWTKTISRTAAIVQEGAPVYLNPVNRKRKINFDEELLVIFFSILNYIHVTFGFAVEINVNFDLITGRKFEKYLNGFGVRRLRQIKYKYFSDKAIELWELCFAFFEQSRRMLINAGHREYLLVKDFYIVFEAIIDELIGDSPLPDGMQKEQDDGKIIDHLYTARGLIENEQTYYIGDSKYYKIGHQVGRESIYKQYTYARNVIQWNLDIFLDGQEPASGVSLRDEETEGYRIVPNFFISAKMDETFNYDADGIQKTDRANNRHTNRHFENRLYDRDTLLLFHYDVNFLFVLSRYARNNASAKAAWKTKVRELFRNEIRDWLKDDYDFYAMRAHPDVNGANYIKENFRNVLGKVYKPYGDKITYSLALASGDEYKTDNEDLLAELRNYFYVEKCDLGENPDDKFGKAPAVISLSGKGDDLALCIVKEGRNFDIAKNKIPADGSSFNVGIALKGSGAMLRLVENFTKAKFLVIHNKGDRYVLFLLDGNGPAIEPRTDIKDDDFSKMIVTDSKASLFLVYTVKTDVSIEYPKLSFKALTTPQWESYNPHLIPLSALMV